jgi:hypothetical protein
MKLGSVTNGTIVATLSEEAYRHLRSSPDTLFLNCTFNFQIYQWEQQYIVQWSPGTVTLEHFPREAPSLVIASTEER